MNLKNTTFEWMCKGEETRGKMFLRIAAQWACILFGLVAIVMMYIPFIIFALAFGAGWFFLYRNKKVEYEFNYMMGDFEISKITNGNRRKKKFQCTLDEISNIKKGMDNQTPKLDFYMDPEQVYTMQVQTSAGTKYVRIEVEERFIQILDQEHKLRK
ncbi:MAG: hypothetical protein RSD28_09080 [Lachnospiraceae bacterium]